MQAKAERINTRRGPYESVAYSENILPGVKENLELINKHYETFSEIFPTLKELDNLVRILTFFRWIRDFHPNDFDLSTFEEAVDYGTPTERLYPVYQTVIALPREGILRAVGGVDLHTQTQVSINQARIDEFLSAYNPQERKTTFDYQGYIYTASPPIYGSTSDALLGRSHAVENESGTRVVIRKEITGDNVIFSDNDVLKYKYERSVNVLGNIEIFAVDYHNFRNGPLSLSWSHQSGGIPYIKYWRVEAANNTLAMQEEVISDNIDDTFLDNLRDWIGRILDLNLPDEVLWEIISLSFDDVKMIKLPNNVLISYKHGDIERHFKWSEQTRTIADVTSKEELFLLLKPDKNTSNAIEIKLMSKKLNGKPQSKSREFESHSAFEVYISDQKKSHVINLENWRGIDSSVMEFPVNLQPFNLIKPYIQEYVKGEYTTSDRTSHPFLIESITKIRKKYGVAKRFALIRSVEGAIEQSEQVWSPPSKRLWLVDPKGFSPHYLSKLNELAKNYPSKAAILQEEWDYSGLGEVEEIIWVTTLSQNEIQERLETPNALALLKGARRLRVMNVNNPVYDLGYNVFYHCPNIELVGAFTYILDFETVYPVIELALQRGVEKELDEELIETVATLKNQYQTASVATPLKLRVARHLDDLRCSWEELSPRRALWRNKIMIDNE